MKKYTEIVKKGPFYFWAEFSSGHRSHQRSACHSFVRRGKVLSKGLSVLFQQSFEMFF
jgi:hypothetical protein